MATVLRNSDNTEQNLEMIFSHRLVVVKKKRVSFTHHAERNRLLASIHDKTLGIISPTHNV
jgi:hypothetical protein